MAEAKLAAGDMQFAFDKLTQDSAQQNASFDVKLAIASSDAFDLRTLFDDQMAEAKLAAGDMQYAFDKLACDNTDQRAAFELRMAKAEHDAGGMKASFAQIVYVHRHPHLPAPPFVSRVFYCLSSHPQHGMPCCLSQVAFDKLTVDSARAEVDAADEKAVYMAKAEHDAAAQKAAFDSRTATKRPGGMKASA